MDRKTIEELFNKIQLPKRLNLDGSFDVTDIQDEVTSKYEVPKLDYPTPPPVWDEGALADTDPGLTADLALEHERLERAITSEIERDIEELDIPSVFEVYERFWPGHQDHNILTEADSIDAVVLHCVQCKMELTVPRHEFDTWMASILLE